MPAKKIRITGHVQGVFFRARTKEVADRLRITGWVRNTEEDTVEIHAEGERVALKEMEDWCHDGPTEAHVEDVQCDAAEEEGYRGFYIRQ